MEIRALRKSDDRSNFRSGDVDLDRFFLKYAGQNQFRLHLGTTYIAAEQDKVLGFVTVAPGNIEGEMLSATTRRRLPRYPVPILRLARLAVDTTATGQGVGRALLRHVFVLSLKMSEELGCVGIFVDAKLEAVAFYERYGFMLVEATEGQLASRPLPTPMFLPLELVAAAATSELD